MRFGWMGAVLAIVIAASVELTAVAVAQRCVPAVLSGWSFGEVLRLGSCEPQVLARRFP